MLQSSDLLVHYNPEKDMILACDASPYGVGAVFYHIMEDGREANYVRIANVGR
jgi:hypothetical protein